METTIHPKIENIELSELAGLRSCLSGQALAPGDAGYETARQAWNLVVDQHPALIIVADSTEDIVEAVRFARQKQLAVAVQATGHGVIREANHSLLVITSMLRDVHINAEAQTAWVSAGAKWAHVLDKAQAAGLAPLLGSTPDVGAVGYTLGGGMGWLARKYGLSADSVNRFELVSADGEKINASATENPDLFWGLRGGGGNFGIVTGMEIRLYPVTSVYGGNLFYPIEKAREVFAHYQQWITTAPDELTSSVLLMNFPPIPAMPEFLRGQSFVMVRGCYCGPVEQGEALLEHWRAWQRPVIDDFKLMPFSQVATISNDPVDPMPSAGSGAWLRDVNAEIADILTHYLLGQGGPSPLVFAEIRHAGGAISKVDPASAAYGNRDAMHILQIIGGAWSPQLIEAVEQHIGGLLQDLSPYLHGGVYMNFLDGEQARTRTRQGFSPQAFNRLKDLKTKYDPQNRFSHSYDFNS